VAKVIQGLGYLRAEDLLAGGLQAHLVFPGDRT
jgi:hypothetical protein